MHIRLAPLQSRCIHWLVVPALYLQQANFSYKLSKVKHEIKETATEEQGWRVYREEFSGQMEMLEILQIVFVPQLGSLEKRLISNI